MINYWLHALRKNGFRKKNCPCPRFCKNARIAGEFAQLLVVPLFRVSCPLCTLLCFQRMMHPGLSQVLK